MSGRTRLGLSLRLLPTLLGLACLRDPTAPAIPPPVVSMVLIEGQAQHEAVITWSTSLAGQIPRGPTPVSASEVSLTVRDAAGNHHPVLPGDRPGWFVVELDAVPGQQYWLEGTIAGNPVAAETRVPSGFAMPEPSADSIRVDRVSVFFQGIPYRFVVDGASAFMPQIVSPDGVFPRGSLTDPADTLLLLSLANTGSPPHHLRVLALDQAAAGWLVSRVPQSNIDGAFGGFGSAAVVLRPLVIE